MITSTLFLLLGDEGALNISVNVISTELVITKLKQGWQQVAKNKNVDGPTDKVN